MWDEPKRLANIAKHGLDFADFEHAFDFVTAIAVPARPSRTGRERFKLIGLFQGEFVVAAIVSPLGTQAVSLVSLRRADPSERRLHEQARE